MTSVPHPPTAARAAAPRLVVVGHDASRTGAPILLESFLRWLAQHHPEVRRELVLLGPGPLVEQYRRSQPTSLPAARVRRTARLAASGARSVGVPSSATEAVVAATDRAVLRRLRAADLVLASTLVSLPPAVAGAGRGVPLVCHVHELDGVAQRVLPPGPRRDAALGRVDRFVAAGPSVEEMLVDGWGVPASRVASIDSFIDPPPDVVGGREGARRRLSIDAARPLLVAVGAAGQRKGTDRFVDLLATWDDAPRSPVGVWVGGAAGTASWQEARHDLEASGLGARCTLLPEVGDVGDLLVAADVVVSVAREDPYPLALLEAAANGVPVVAMDSGGPGHILRSAGCDELLVPGGDLLGMRDVIDRLAVDVPRRHRLGRSLATWVRTTHLTEHLAPQLWRAVEEAT